MQNPLSSLKSADIMIVDALSRDLPDGVVKPAEPRYLEEPRGRWRGQAGAILTPQNSAQVAQILTMANAAHVPVIPYAGGTSLVGGQLMEAGPVPLVLSLEKLNKIKALQPDEYVMIAEAGAILEDIHTAAQAADRLFPLSIAAKGTAQIGGILATNAGGINVLRYGNARDLCLGLEVVFADGRIWNGLGRLRKDNTGYDLRNLLIGSEGTLGVITAATLKLAPIPAQQGTALFVVESPEAALSLLSLIRSQVAEGVSAFELIDGQGLEFLKETMPGVRRPFDPSPKWMALVELGLGRGVNPAEVLEEIFADAMERGLTNDAVLAQSETQAKDLWAMREQIPEANRQIGAIVSHDISLPLGVIAEFIARARATLAARGDYRINCFGHLGDGNLHFNLFPAEGKTKQDYPGHAPELQRLIHDMVVEMGGSFSAEHGVGRLKRDDLERYGDPTRLAMMRSIKQALDPNGILNPGAVLNL